MIPKVIHFCWLSEDPIPESLQKCMLSWKKYLPDYQIIHWNFNRFDKDSSVWVKQAFENKKYAFAADYIRLYALYNYGGIYLDMDVEVLKTFNPFLVLNSIICFESDSNKYPEVAAFGAEKESPWVKECLDYYSSRHFIDKNGNFEMTPLPQVVKKILDNKGYKFVPSHNINEALLVSGDKNISIFPSDFFSPKSYKTKLISITKNTVSIHHFAGTWITKKKYELVEEKFWNLLGLTNYNIINKVIWLPTNIRRKFFEK